LIRIAIGNINDVEKVMEFIHNHWKSDHILSKDKNLFLYEFQNEDKLNMALAKNSKGDIVGIFGFFYYNSLDSPDIGGSLWKVTTECAEPLLGLKLRNYIINNIEHRFFAAPGAGIQTKPIYDRLRMNWNRMNQFFIVNPLMEKYFYLTLPTGFTPVIINKPKFSDYKIIKASSVQELKNFEFHYSASLAPYKDFNYLNHKFFKHPIYDYDVFYVAFDLKITNIFVCRSITIDKHKSYRMVDFYGIDENMPIISYFLKNKIIRDNYEYVDFVSYGFNVNNMNSAGFHLLDFDSSEVVVPNLMEPLVNDNTPIYCVSDKLDNIDFRQCKADGDQDRPNKFL
jgi:hypothetical protein